MQPRRKGDRMRTWETITGTHSYRISANWMYKVALDAMDDATHRIKKLERDKDEREMKKYQDMLEARQRAREDEEEARLARLAAQAAVAQQRFDQAETDADG